MSTPIQSPRPTRQLTYAERARDEYRSKVAVLQAPYNQQIAALGWDSFAETPEGLAFLKQVERLQDEFHCSLQPAPAAPLCAPYYSLRKT